MEGTFGYEGTAMFYFYDSNLPSHLKGEFGFLEEKLYWGLIHSRYIPFSKCLGWSPLWRNRREESSVMLWRGAATKHIFAT